MVQFFILLIERIESLHKAVGIGGSRALCLSSEVERTNHNEGVSNASQTKGKWSRIFLHGMSLMPIWQPMCFVNGLPAAPD
jgi:hypothetical protein